MDQRRTTGGVVLLFALALMVALLGNQDMLVFTLPETSGTDISSASTQQTQMSTFNSLGLNTLTSPSTSTLPNQPCNESTAKADIRSKTKTATKSRSGWKSADGVSDPGIVPFYMYPPEIFSGFRDCQGVGFKKETNVKFDTDVQLFLTFARHPWRVYNLTEAKVAIIPIPFNRLARGACTEAYQKHIRNMKTVLGKRLYSKEVKHVVIVNDWKTKYVREALRSVKPLLQAVKLHRERHKCTFGIGFSTAYANWRLFHSQNFLYSMPKPHAQRKFLVSFLGQVDGRPGYADRYALFKTGLDRPMNDSYIMTFSTKLHLRPCPIEKDAVVDRCYMHRVDRQWAQTVTKDSNFTLALRGDDEGSDRFQNAMIENTLLVAVIEKFDRDVGWMPFPSLIPWRDIVITIPRAQFQADPVGEINKLRQIPQEDLDRRRALMRQYAPAIDVEYAGGFVYASHILKQAMITKC